MSKPRIRVKAISSAVPATLPQKASSPSTMVGLEAGRYGRRLSSFLPSRQHVNSLISQSGGTITARARYLVRNNGYANSAAQCFAVAVIGCGIIPSWKGSKDKALRKQVQDLWRKWTDYSDAEGLTDFYGQQRRAAREMFIAGETFIRRRYRYASDGLPVPVQYQMIPAEQLDESYSENLSNGNTVRQGIEFNVIGKRIAYHFWKKHPGDTTEIGNTGERSRVPAEQIIHLFDPIEGGQLRGLSAFVAAVVKLWTLDQYDDAELERKKVAALFTGFITRPDPQGTMFDEDAEEEAKEGDGQATVTLEPGVMNQLLPGETVEFAEPADSGNSYEPFQYRTLCQIAVALGIPYFDMTGDLNKANFSSARVGLIPFRRRIEALQHAVFVFLMCRAVFNDWLDQAVLSGALKIADYNTNKDQYQQVNWITPRWDWIDPLKDINAEVIAINNNLKSRSSVVRSYGEDPEEVDDEIATDQKREEALGIRKEETTSTAAPAAPKKDEVDDEEDNTSEPGSAPQQQYRN